jgi:2-polyprenyl-6-methoxyphenol hydroxylase-like FAD-dependent oxidoreductase
VERFDVAVVGASIAGCTAATLFARAGARVALIERSPDPGAWKRTCTHMIQSSANPVLDELGVADSLERAGGVRTSVRMWTEAGWIVDPGGRPAGRNLCVRRSTLDPALRALALDTPGVEAMLGRRADALLTDGDAAGGVRVVAADGSSRSVSAALTVAADGRDSTVASLAQVDARVSPNERFAYFAYYRDLPLETGSDSLTWLDGVDVAYAFPVDGGLTLLAAFPTKRRLEEFKRDRAAALEATFAGLPRAPRPADGERVSDVIGRLELSNTTRPAAMAGLAFAGDAALASDPAVGVGCGWALQSASWLVEETGEAVVAGAAAALDAALKRYRARHHRALAPHQSLIEEGSRGRPPSRTERMVMAAAVKDPAVADRFHAYATRNIGPREFIGPGTTARAIWSYVTKRRPAEAAG